MDERVASMREFVANFWIPEILRGVRFRLRGRRVAAQSSHTNAPLARAVAHSAHDSTCLSSGGAATVRFAKSTQLGDQECSKRLQSS
jgi:hypothetical protein